MDYRVLFGFVAIFFALTTVFLVIFVDPTASEFNIFCNISQMDAEEDYPIAVVWNVRRDPLYGVNVAIYSARICDRHHCIDRTTVLTIDADIGANDTREALICPVMNEETTSVQNWDRIKELDGKKALIYKLSDKMWPNAANTLLIENLISNGTTHVCIADGNTVTYNLTDSLPQLHVVSDKTREILLICTIVMMALSAVACITALCLCMWRRCCRRQTLVVAGGAWMNRVTVTWPDTDLDIPALADAMRVPIVEVDRFKILVRRNQDDKMAEDETFQIPFDPKWELGTNTNLRFGTLLGIGPVGKMIVVEVSNEMAEVKTVAVKMLKQSFKSAELKSLICELEIMKRLEHHENIVNLIGCCTSNCAPLLLMDYAELGNMQTFLKRDTNVQELTYDQQLSFASQIAKGMQFLTESKCVHRNLSSRNILLTVELKVKISNHASYHDLTNSELLEQMTSRDVMSIRWLAPETLSDRIFDFKSDVWSFGIVLWEIMSNGATPYPKLGGDREELQKAICSGYQMEQPENCTDQMYKVMESCWSFHPFNRPTFKHLVEVANKFLSANDIGLLRLAPNDSRKFSRITSVYCDEQPPDF